MNDSTPTAKRLRVYAMDEEPIPAPVPTHAPVMDRESWVNFWVLSLMAIAALGSIAWMFGWLRPPQQATLDELAKTQQQLLDTKTELNRITNCVNN